MITTNDVVNANVKAYESFLGRTFDDTERSLVFDTLCRLDGVVSRLTSPPTSPLYTVLTNQKALSGLDIIDYLTVMLRSGHLTTAYIKSEAGKAPYNSTVVVIPKTQHLEANYRRWFRSVVYGETKSHIYLHADEVISFLTDLNKFLTVDGVWVSRDEPAKTSNDKRDVVVHLLGPIDLKREKKREVFVPSVLFWAFSYDMLFTDCVGLINNVCYWYYTQPFFQNIISRLKDRKLSTLLTEYTSRILDCERVLPFCIRETQDTVLTTMVYPDSLYYDWWLGEPDDICITTQELDVHLKNTTHDTLLKPHHDNWVLINKRSKNEKAF